MPQQIEFETKSDRELLVLVAQKTNETVSHLAKINDKLVAHEKRITVLESQTGCNKTKPSWKTNWQVMTWIGCVVALIIVELGQKLCWW